MTISLTRRSFLALAGAGLAAGDALALSHRPVAKDGLVLGQVEGAKAGQDMLAAGGNAVDAIVTAALVAGVVAVRNCGIAGYGGHMVIGYPRGGKVNAIDFNSTAPASVKADLYPLDARGKVKGNVNTYGWLAVGVPGTLAGMQLALDRHGTVGLGKAIAPAIRYARDGVVVSKQLAKTLAGAAKRLRADPGSAKLFFDKDKPLAEGARYRNPDLAALLEVLAKRNSVESFYRGDIARKIATAFKDGGLVTEKDLASYRAREVKPLTLDWGGQTIHTAPLTAGGLTILQVLATLKALGWEKWDRKDPDRAQARLEAMRIAWHDRLRLLGDPEQVTVPVKKLLSEQYAQHSAKRIRAAIKANKPVDAAGDGRSADGTIHLTAVDASGLMAALTLTHGGSLGAQVTIPGLGLILGHGLSRFDPRPKHANSLGPGKKPLHNMCPTIVTQDGRPTLALGATGGRRIPNTVLDVLVGRVVEGKSLAEAVQAPRMHTEGERVVTVESSWPSRERKRLEEVGYTVRIGPGATLNAIERDQDLLPRSVLQRGNSCGQTVFRSRSEGQIK